MLKFFSNIEVLILIFLYFELLCKRTTTIIFRQGLKSNYIDKRMHVYLYSVPIEQFT